MNDHELSCANALRGVTFLPATPQKRFAREMGFRAKSASENPLTEKQSMWLSSLVWTFRRQISDKILVAACGIRTNCAGYGPADGMDERRRQLMGDSPGYVPAEDYS